MIVSARRLPLPYLDRLVAGFFVFCFSTLSALGQPGPPPPPAPFPDLFRSLPGSLPGVPASQSVSSTATISGVVTWQGAIPSAEPFEVNQDALACAPTGELINDRVQIDPETRGVQNAVVWLESQGGRLPPVPQPPRGLPPVVLTLQECRFTTSVLALPQSAPLWVRSEDEVLHTVVMKHSSGPERSFPLGYRGAFYSANMRRSGVHRLRCAQHPWESAAVFVAENPYYTITGSDGSFTLTDIPPGTYTLHAWHDGMSAQPVRKAGLVKEYRFSPGSETRTTVRIPLTNTRQIKLQLGE